MALDIMENARAISPSTAARAGFIRMIPAKSWTEKSVTTKPSIIKAVRRVCW